MGSATWGGRGVMHPRKYWGPVCICPPPHFRDPVVYTINIHCFSLKKQWNAINACISSVHCTVHSVQSLVKNAAVYMYT